MRWALWAVYAVMWVGGAINGGVYPRAVWTSPLFLTVAGMVALYENRREWKALVAAALIGFGIEQIGVHTGLPFGRYVYTDGLSPSVFGVPLAIAFSWLILIDFVRGVTSSIALGAMLMVAIDLVIDPLAAGPLHYWIWLDHGPYYGIPWSNFTGWLIASGAILACMPRPTAAPLVLKPGLTILAFFVVAALGNRMWLPAGIGAAIILLPLLRRRSLLEISSGMTRAFG